MRGMDNHAGKQKLEEVVRSKARSMGSSLRCSSRSSPRSMQNTSNVYIVKNSFLFVCTAGMMAMRQDRVIEMICATAGFG